MTYCFSHISPYDLTALATLFTGATVALLLAFIKNPRQRANLFLGAAVAVTVLKTGGLTSAFLPALGPLLFFYTRQLTHSEWRPSWKDLLHFVPMLAGYWLPAWLVVMQLLPYLYFSHRGIQDFYRQLPLIMMDRPRLAFRQLDRALRLLGGLCLLSIIYADGWFAVAALLIAVAVEAILRPDGDVQMALPGADASDAREKGRRLKRVVAAGRLYEDTELTLATLAAQLNIPPHELSRIINLGLEKNFNDFINEFRVREVVRKMQDPAADHVTLLGIAYEAGFNSKTTFNRVFKEMTGKTPLEYKNGLKKEVPIDKMGPPPGVRPVLLRSERLPHWAPAKNGRKMMIGNYLKIAYRQLLKQKMYAAIKIGGFALGVAACLLITLYIRDETHYDQSYPDADHIMRVVGTGQIDTGLDWPAPMAAAIQHDFSEVASAGRIMVANNGHAGNQEMRRADQVQNTYEQGFIYADQAFLDIFQLPMVYGNGSTALKEPMTMVISKSMADRYYHGKNPIGQVMYLDNDEAHPYRISAVMADIPANSHLHGFNCLLTLAGVEFWPGELTDWGSYNYFIYLKTKPGTDAAAFEKKFNAGIVDKYLLPQFRKQGVKNAETEVKKIVFRLQPVKDINLFSYDLPDGFLHGDIRLIWLFGGIAVFILLIACINFINLSTAKSANRAKEVGLRKVVGSYRSSLVMQFLTESLIYSFISFVLGIFIAWMLLSYFNTIASKSLVMPWLEWWFVPLVLLAAAVVGTLAGLYPAFYLSRFRPMQVLKGSIAGGSKSSPLRNGLVVFQFATSILLIIGTIVIYHQTQFILHRKIGFDKDQVMVLQGTTTLGDNIQTFKKELSTLAAVKSISISDYLPIEGTHRNGNGFVNEGREKIDNGVPGQIWRVDENYLKTMGIKLAAGRDFSATMTDDTAGHTIIINQEMARQLRLENPLGRRITNGDLLTIVGVVEDFNYNSMRGDIGPLVFRFGISPAMMTVKFSGKDASTTVADVSALWNKFLPDQPIRYTFLDKQFANMYADVLRTGNIFTSFAVLAIIIACLGLFALSAFMAEQRSKEIGIRKVLGASVENITTLLSIEFVKLVLLAIVIASPVAWWLMNKWLQDFAYRISISWWMFAVAGGAAIFIALVTVSFQSVRAALADPVERLRSE